MDQAPKNRMESPALDRRPHFTTRELIAEAERESKMRRNVYERQIRAGRMSRADADRRIDMMEAIARRLTVTAHL